MTQDELLEQLTSQAIGAMNAGADPLQVNARLRKMLQEQGISKVIAPVVPDNADEDTVSKVQNFWQGNSDKVSKATKAAYKNIVIPEVVQDLQKSQQIPNSPARVFGNVESGTDTNYYGDVESPTLAALLNMSRNEQRAARSVAAKGLAGLAVAGGGLLSVMNPAEAVLPPENRPSEDAFRAAEFLRNYANEQGVGNEGPGAVVGGVAGGFLPTSIAGGAAGEALDAAADEGLSEGYKELAKGTAINEAALGLGLPFKSAAGLTGAAKRAAVQIPGSVGLTAVDKAIEGEDLTGQDIGAAIGMGAFGSLFAEHPRSGKHPKIETGDKAFDAGAKAIEDMAPGGDIESTTINLNKPFKQSFDPGWRWKPEKPVQEVSLDTSPLEAVEQMKSAIERRRLKARENTNAVFAEQDKADEIFNAVRGLEEPKAPEVAPTNDALNTPEMEQLRSQLQREGAIEGAEMPQQPEGVNVTTNPVKEPLGPISKRKLGKQKLGVDEFGNTVDRATTAAVKTRDMSLEDAIAAAEKRRAAFNADDSMPRPDVITVDSRVDKGFRPLLRKDHNIASGVLDKLSKGDLTGSEFLRSVADGDHVNYAQAPEMKAFASELIDKAKRFGGEGVRIVTFNPENPAHMEVRSRMEQHNPGQFQNSRAIYDPPTHRIYVMQDVTVGTLMHEMDHAVKASAIEAGMKGKLNGTAQRAFRNLDNSLNILREHIIARADQHHNAKKAAGMDPRMLARLDKDMRYGLTNLHELNAEIKGNPTFREFLHSIKIDDLPLSPKAKTFMSGFRNVLDLFMKGFNRLIGVSDKATTAYDVLHGGSEKFFSHISNEEASAMRGVKQIKERQGSAIQYPFEQVEPRADITSGKETEPQPASNTVIQTVKEWLTAKGISPTVFHAKRTKQNITSLGELKAIQSANRLGEVRTPENSELISKALKGDVDSFGKLDNATKKVVQQAFNDNYDMSLAIGKQIALDPNATEEQRNIGKKIIANAGAYQATAYAATEVKGFMKDKMKLYEKAKAKMAAGKELSPEEMKAYKSADIAKKYLEQTWLPEIDQLKNYNTEKLEDLYRFYTNLNPDSQLKGLASAERKDALIGAIAAKMRDMSDKDSVLEELLKNVAGVGEKKNKTRLYYQGLRRSADVYSMLKDVPPELRQFWEEVNDPIARNIATVRRQHSYLANLTAQNQLRAEGMGRLFSSTPTAVHSQPLSGEKLGPLQGLHTSPDVARALDSVFQMDSTIGDMLDATITDNSGLNTMLYLGRKAFGGVRYVAGKTKLLSVLGNPGNFILNFEGSMLQLAANGNINPVTYAKGWKMIADTMMAERRGKLSADAEDAFRYGLVEYSHIEELRGNKAAQRILQYMKEAEGSENPMLTIAKKVADHLKKVPEAYKEAYAAMDLYTKFANWHNELDFWRDYDKRHGINRADAQLKDMVARRINDTNITPSMSPKILKGSEGLGATRFATYYAEVFRTSKNNLKVGKEDFLRGIKEGDGQLAVHGLKRLLGTTGAVVAHNKQFAAIAKLAAGVMGLTAAELSDNDPRKQYMDKDSFWNGQQPMIVSDPEHPEAGEYVYDISRPDPFAPLWNPTHAAINAIAALASGDKKTAETQAQIAADNLVSLVNQRNTMWTALGKIVAGSPPASKRTAKEYYNWTHEQLTGIGMDSKTADRVLNALEPATPKAMSNAAASLDIPSPTLAKLKAAGIGAQKMDVKTDIGRFLGYRVKDGIQKAKADYLDLMKQDYTSSPERLEKGFVSSLKKADELYTKLQGAVQAAKAQGATRKELVEELKMAGVGQEMMYTLLHDKPLKASVLEADLRKDLKSDVAGATPEERQEAKERFRYNQRQLHALIRKYRSANIEDL